MTAAATDTPANVANKSGGCPSTLADMPEGSTVLFIVLNVGDTSANDLDVGGYYDNVVLGKTSGTVIYDFEFSPSVRDECKKGGWASFGFTNQGRCVSWVNRNL